MRYDVILLLLMVILVYTTHIGNNDMGNYSYVDSL